MKNKPGYMTTFKERLSFWSYFIGQNVYYNLTASFIAAYLIMQDIDPIQSGAVLLVVKVWDAVNDPLFGYIFDKTKFKNGLKSLPWLRVAVMGIPVVTIALFSIPGFLSPVGKLVWFGVAYILWDTIYTLSDVPAYAMLNTMTDNQEERTMLLSINRVFSGAGYLVFLLVYTLTDTGIGWSASFAVAVLSIFSFLTMVPMILFCKERNYHPEGQEETFTIRQMLRYLKSNKYLLRYYAGYMATDALKTCNAVLVFAAFYLFGRASYGTILGYLNMVPGVFAAMAMPFLLKRFDKMKTLFLCNLLSIILGFVIYFAGYQNMTTFMVLTCIRTIPLSVVGILAFMFTPDCAEYGEYTSGINAKGITFAIQTFSVKITGAISSSLAMFLLGLFGWISVQAENFEKLAELNIAQSPLALKGLWIVYALIPVIGMVISSFFYLSYHLTDKDVQIMAKCNSGEITREEAESRISRKY